MSKRRSYLANGVLLLVSLLAILALAAPPALGDDPWEYRKTGEIYLPYFVKASQGLDFDGDGVLDDKDECPTNPGGWVVNEVGCSLPNLCPCSDDRWEDHDDFVRCVSDTAGAFVAEGLITEEEWRDLVSGAVDSPCGTEPPPASCDSCNWGWPSKLPFWLYPNHVINFGVAGDPQLGSLFHSINKWIPHDDLLGTQKTADKIKSKCEGFNPPCIGVAMVGDLTDNRECDSMLAFRQIFEYDYLKSRDKGCMDNSDVHGDFSTHSYSWRHRMDMPMFPLLGNHDDPTEIGHGTIPHEYLEAIVKGSSVLYRYPIEQRAYPNLPPSYFKDNYAWEWGGFHFLSLGLWAFYGGYQNGHGHRDSVDQTKVDWLRRHLETIGKQKPVIIFQHFGWGDVGQTWWSQTNADLLLNVLCDRATSSDPCDPYNVLGIFSGHTHNHQCHKICPDQDTTGHSCDEKCSSGHEFWNFVTDDAGVLSDNDESGFMTVQLNAWPLGYPESPLGGMMRVTQYSLKNFDFDYDNWNHDENNKTHYDFEVHATYEAPWRYPFASLTFAQTEPAGGTSENCAGLSADAGRLFDSDCSEADWPAACFDPENSAWNILDDLMTWEDGRQACLDRGQVLAIWPQTHHQQAALWNALRQSSHKGAWVNYTDQRQEGDWEYMPLFQESWQSWEPDNGAGLPDRSWGENCAVLDTDGKLRDINCESPGYPFVCKDSGGQWYIAKDASGVAKTGMWKQGFDEAYCGEDGFVMAADSTQYSDMVKDVEGDLAGLRFAWVNLSDLEMEDQWLVNRGPWPPEPANIPGTDCAAAGAKKDWDHVEWSLFDCDGGRANWGFACRPVETGEWKATAEEGSRNWSDGFNACRKEFGPNWVFDAPMRQTGHTRFNIFFKELLRQRNAQEGVLWINYTDQWEDGLHQRGHWQSWEEGQPDNADAGEDCALLTKSEEGSALWSDRPCDEKWSFLCIVPGHRSVFWGPPGKTWHEASLYCQQKQGGYLWLPANPFDQKDVVTSYLRDVSSMWIRYNDVDSEGHWVDWLY